MREMGQIIPGIKCGGHVALGDGARDKTHTCTSTKADVELPGTSPNIEKGGVDSSNVRLLCTV